MDGSQQNCAKLKKKKPALKDYILYDSTFITFLKDQIICSGGRSKKKKEEEEAAAANVVTRKFIFSETTVNSEHVEVYACL